MYYGRYDYGCNNYSNYGYYNYPNYGYSYGNDNSWWIIILLLFGCGCGFFFL